MPNRALGHLGSSTPPLAPFVDGCGHRLEMVRVAAGASATEMVEHLALRDISSLLAVHDPVCTFSAAWMDAVAFAILRSSPEPAPVDGVYSVHEKTHHPDAVMGSGSRMNRFADWSNLQTQVCAHVGGLQR